MPPIMRCLIVGLFFCHYKSVFALLDHEDVGVVVLSRLYHTLMQFQTLERFRAAWDHVRVNTLVTVQVVQVMRRRANLLRPQCDQGGVRGQGAPNMQPDRLRSYTPGYDDAAA